MNSNYDYIHAVDVAMSCKLCDQILNSPKVLRCGHIYCENCILAYFTTSPTCPECTMPAHRYDISSCPLLDNILSVYSNYKLQFVPSSSSVNVEHTISTANHDITNLLQPSSPIKRCTDNFTAVQIPLIECTKPNEHLHDVIAGIANEAYIDITSCQSLPLVDTVPSPLISVHHSNQKEPIQSTDTALVDEAHLPTENDEASSEIFLNLVDSNEAEICGATKSHIGHNSAELSATQLLSTQDSHTILLPHANDSCSGDLLAETIHDASSESSSQMLPDSGLPFESSLGQHEVNVHTSDVVLGESCSSVINKVSLTHLFLHID